MILQWKVMHPNFFTFMSGTLWSNLFVISHWHNFSYMLCMVIMFEWADYSLVKWWLENAGAVWGKEHNFHIPQVTCTWGWWAAHWSTKSKILLFLELILACSALKYSVKAVCVTHAVLLPTYFVVNLMKILMQQRFSLSPITMARSLSVSSQLQAKGIAILSLEFFPSLEGPLF